MRFKLSPAAARVVAAPAFRVLAASWRIRTVHEERWRPLYDARRPHVFLLWHEVLLPLLWQHRRQSIAIVVSEARDGQYLADFAASLGYRTVRGSSTRGAARALLGAVRELQAGHAVAFTPDGPRGPRRELKPGAIAAAQRGQGTVVPLHAEANRAWRLDSWDQFMVPKPGTRVRIVYGRPFEVAAGDAGLAAGLADAEAGLRDIAGGRE
ncbi:MAG: lysophospholipid acyltransferase family protein [Gemmatimonadota bacterium]|nr:lysophospholipid acyltransferase family protein [Gemmatimonadales bacterium]MDQ3136548.1 lysophospholipid acyltransferase family protein [Gemmatimonadota bacterium]